jgi:hypothetical protein
MYNITLLINSHTYVFHTTANPQPFTVVTWSGFLLSRPGNEPGSSVLSRKWHRSAIYVHRGHAASFGDICSQLPAERAEVLSCRSNGRPVGLDIRQKMKLTIICSCLPVAVLQLFCAALDCFYNTHLVLLPTKTTCYLPSKDLLIVLRWKPENEHVDPCTDLGRIRRNSPQHHPLIISVQFSLLLGSGGH